MSPPASPPEPADEGSGKPPPRSKLACKTCRAIKVRCIRPPEPNTPCARCSRYELVCSDPPVIKRKGRPPGSKSQRVAAAAAAAAAEQKKRIEPSPSKPPQDGHHTHRDHRPSHHQSSSHVSNHHHRPPQRTHPSHASHPSNGPGAAHTDDPAMLQFLRPYAPPSSASSQVSPPGYGNPPSISPGNGNFHVASDHLPRRNNHLSMAEHLDPGRDEVEAQGPFFNNAPTGRARARTPSSPGDRDKINESDDPVSLRALSEVEANSLVQLFHQRLNPLVAVLDPHLHTMAYLRRTSSVLFSTVLASASRFFRHDLHPVLLSHARTVLDRALQVGSTDIGVIQSLMIQTYWKDPEDTSGWMKVGMAIRLGYSLFWHIPRSDPLPEDERQARELLNAERTWFCLFSFDRGQSYIHGLPYLIRLNHHGDPEQWARDHLYLGRSVDMHIAASIQLCKLKDEWGALCERAPEPAFLEVAIETLTAQAENLVSKWFNKDNPPPEFDENIEGVLHWSILDFILVMKRYRYEMSRPSGRDPVRLDQCLYVVSRITQEIEALAANGLLIVMQDSASCMTSSLIVFVRNNYRDATRAQKSFMLTTLHRIFLAHTSLLLEEDSKTAPGYVVRFIRRVLSALSTESRHASPGPGGFPGVTNASTYPPGSAGGTNGAGGSGGGEGGGIGGGGGGGGDAGVFEFFHELGLEEFIHVPEFVAQNEADDGRYWANMLLSEVIPQQTGI